MPSQAFTESPVGSAIVWLNEQDLEFFQTIQPLKCAVQQAGRKRRDEISYNMLVPEPTFG